ncbi:SAM-dependent methyltransferase [Streptomyces sp. NPDC087294]|uniref:SAM-dependent methyltransferase n=1 Tax=Streptomyces sp. NPDC087294 TaxID=3365777 RepID=UPI0038081D49
MPRGTDFAVPSNARMTNILLGGPDRHLADREAVRSLEQLRFNLRQLTREARQFAGAAVGALVDGGIRQVLDLGCGLPRTPDLHEIAAQRYRGRLRPRTLYCDRDPHVLKQWRAILEESDGARVLGVDVSRPALLSCGGLRTYLDLDLPVVAVVSGLLECLTDTAAERLLATLTAGLAPGSAVVVATPVCSITAQAELITRQAREVTAGAWGRMRTPYRLKALHPAFSRQLMYDTSVSGPELATTILDVPRC